MKRKLLTLNFVLVVLVITGSGCTSGSDDYWNYKEGYVAVKTKNKVLVVQKKLVNTDASVSNILEEAKPNAMWITVPKTSYDTVAVGDRVSIKIEGGINQSYPGQANGELEVK